MNSLSDLVDNALRSLSEGNVSAEAPARTGSDGLLLCPVCGTPRQKRVEVNLGGEPRTVVVPVLCACELRKDDERAAREEAERTTARAKRLRDECFAVNLSLRSCTFEADDGDSPDLSSRCRRYADTFNPAEPYGLLMYGGVGTGKSYMAAAVANRVIDRGFTALVTDIGTVATVMESSFGQRESNLKRILGYDLLVIDDIGAQRSTEYMMQHVYSVIDGRYRQGRPMVITTNLSAEGIAAARGNTAWNRIFDRVFERCYAMKVTGTSRRRQGALDVQKLMSERLDG